MYSLSPNIDSSHASNTVYPNYGIVIMGKYNRVKFTTMTIKRDVKSRLDKEAKPGESYGQTIDRLLSGSNTRFACLLLTKTTYLTTNRVCEC